jgi:hypothetical protein
LQAGLSGMAGWRVWKRRFGGLDRDQSRLCSECQSINFRAIFGLRAEDLDVGGKLIIEDKNLTGFPM